VVKKRIIGMITVKAGWAVQSFGYRKYLPLGRPECLAENLDRWGADEIVVTVIDRSRQELGPDFEVLGRIANLGLSTPLVYAGGVRTAEDAARVVGAGADRVALDAVLRDRRDAVSSIADVIGAQAVIATIPVVPDPAGSGEFEWLDYRTRMRASRADLASWLAPLIQQRHVSEVLLVDATHDGDAGRFDRSLIDAFPIDDVPLIAFGGAGDAETCASLLAHQRVSAVAIGNRLAYRELAVQRARSEVALADVRPPRFVTSEAGW
jgi:cyclase